MPHHYGRAFSKNYEPIYAGSNSAAMMPDATSFAGSGSLPVNSNSYPFRSSISLPNVAVRLIRFKP